MDQNGCGSSDIPSDGTRYDVAGVVKLLSYLISALADQSTGRQPAHLANQGTTATTSPGITSHVQCDVATSPRMRTSPLSNLFVEAA